MHDDRLLFARVAHGRFGAWQLVAIQRGDATVRRSAAATATAVTALTTLATILSGGGASVAAGLPVVAVGSLALALSSAIASRPTA